MKRLSLHLFIAVLVINLFSCTSDNLEEYYGTADCMNANITYSNHIKPIIDANCAISGCHVSGTGLPSWETYTNVSNNAERIAQRTLAGEMPPSLSGKSLTIEEVEQIQCWVDAGAPNN